MSRQTVKHTYNPGDIEILITGRGDKTVRPRSFTPGLEQVTPPPPSVPAPSPGHKLGSVVVVSEHNKQELAFQPRPYSPDNYRVTDFSHKTTPQGHSYRWAHLQIIIARN